MCDERAVVARRRARGETTLNAGLREPHGWFLGELSSSRQAHEGAALAPGNQAILRELTDARKRPHPTQRTVAILVLRCVPRTPFELDEQKFSRNLRSARRGVAAGPSGMTTEHLRPLLDDSRALYYSFYRMCDMLARAIVPLRSGRLIALTTPSGGVRGIVAGDVGGDWWPRPLHSSSP